MIKCFFLFIFHSSFGLCMISMILDFRSVFELITFSCWVLITSESADFLYWSVRRAFVSVPLSSRYLTHDSLLNTFKHFCPLFLYKQFVNLWVPIDPSKKRFDLVGYGLSLVTWPNVVSPGLKKTRRTSTLSESLNYR